MSFFLGAPLSSHLCWLGDSFLKQSNRRFPHWHGKKTGAQASMAFLGIFLLTLVSGVESRLRTTVTTSLSHKRRADCQQRCLVIDRLPKKPKALNFFPEESPLDTPLVSRRKRLMQHRTEVKPEMSPQATTTQSQGQEITTQTRTHKASPNPGASKQGMASKARRTHKHTKTGAHNHNHISTQTHRETLKHQQTK